MLAPPQLHMVGRFRCAIQQGAGLHPGCVRTAADLYADVVTIPAICIHARSLGAVAGACCWPVKSCPAVHQAGSSVTARSLVGRQEVYRYFVKRLYRWTILAQRASALCTLKPGAGILWRNTRCVMAQLGSQSVDVQRRHWGHRHAHRSNRHIMVVLAAYVMGVGTGGFALMS